MDPYSIFIEILEWVLDSLFESNRTCQPFKLSQGMDGDDLSLHQRVVSDDNVLCRPLEGMSKV